MGRHFPRGRRDRPHFGFNVDYNGLVERCEDGILYDGVVVVSKVLLS